MKKILIIFLTVTLILLVSCDTARKEENNNESESANQTEIEENNSIIIDNIDFVGMTYHEIVRILGSDYEDVGSGAIILQWQLDDGRKLSAWMVKNGGSSLEDCIVQSFEIE